MTTVSREVPAPPAMNLYSVIQNGIVVALGTGILGVVFLLVLHPVIEKAPSVLDSGAIVEESLTTVLGNMLIMLAPFFGFITVGRSLRESLKRDPARTVAAAFIATLIVYGVVSAAQFTFQVGQFSPQPTLGMTLTQTEEGILVEGVDEGSTAAEAGFQEGDIITAIRREEITLQVLQTRVEEAKLGDPFRLRFLRGSEELQATVELDEAIQINTTTVMVGLFAAFIVTGLAMVLSGGLVPYILLILTLVPLLIGYLWLIIATVSRRTHGLIPVDANDKFGGFTLENWEFLTRSAEGSNITIWEIAINSLTVALFMTVMVVLISSMAGYALSRMQFPGRKTFLSLTLLLHGFPAITLVIPIFFVLQNISKLPLIGQFLGFNSIGGVALVMVAFELPLGVWLMKGFFDNIPWDIERSAMIDGASRWRTYWEILLPQIRPGLLALGIFAFISGWGAYLIPATYTIGTRATTLSVYLNQVTGDTAPLNWNKVAAIGLFQMIPVLIFFIFAQEYLLSIYAGGTKGSS